MAQSAVPIIYLYLVFLWSRAFNQKNSILFFWSLEKWTKDKQMAQDD